MADGNLPLVRRLLASPSPVDARNPDGLSLTSLSYAAIGGHEELFEYLVFDIGHDDDELSRVREVVLPASCRCCPDLLRPPARRQDGDNNTLLHLLASLPSLHLTPPHRSSAFTSGELAVRLASIYYDRCPSPLLLPTRQPPLDSRH